MKKKQLCWSDEFLWFFQIIAPGWCPPVISWFINPWTIVISAINHRFNGSYVHQLNANEPGHHLVQYGVFHQWSYTSINNPYVRLGFSLINHPIWSSQMIWANYNNSLTWIKAIWGWFPLLTMIYPEMIAIPQKMTHFFTDDFALAPAKAPGWGPPGPPPDAWKARRWKARPWQGRWCLVEKKRGTHVEVARVSFRRGFWIGFLDSFGWT